MVNCPICQTQLKEKRIPAHSPDFSFGCNCERCGRFVLSFRAEKVLANLLNDENKEEKIAILSHAIRKMQNDDDNNWPTIDIQLMDAILKNPLPTPSEQVDNLIRWFGENVSAGRYVTIEPLIFQSIIGAKNKDGLMWILNHLVNSGFLQHETSGVNLEPYVLTLSFDGWQYYEQLKRGTIDNRKAFMAMKFGDLQLNEIVEKYFKPAIACTGFELYSLNEKPKAGLIDDHLRVEIRNSRFLISDLTHENAGAYWEAGYAEGLGKPVIYTCNKEKFDKEKSHFDTNHHLTITWDDKEPQKAMEMLKATIRATLPDEAKLTDD